MKPDQVKDIQELFKCSQCGEFKTKKEMYKIEKFSIGSFFDNKKEYKLVCSRCVERDKDE